MSRMTVLIQKADGEMEAFDRTKLERSLRRSGAVEPLRDKVIQAVEGYVRNGMTTEEIYRYAFDLLRQYEYDHPTAAARYSIKRAIIELGPSGFPFEQFVAGVMRAHGATNVETGVHMMGHCVEHEVDVLGTKDGKRFGMEVKFHNTLGTKTDTKDVLYVHSRFNDLKSASGKNHVDEGWLVTNTRFTHNVIRYAHCSGGVKLLGWDYPRDRGLERLVEESGLHPITMLTTLSSHEKRTLLEMDKVLCSDILENRDILFDAGVKPDKVELVLEQARALQNENGRHAL